MFDFLPGDEPAWIPLCGGRGLVPGDVGDRKPDPVANKNRDQ
jgi:hypothetical protein